MSLTISEIDAAALGDKLARPTDERGLYLEIMRAGARLWQLTSRVQGTETQMTPGAYADVRVTIAPERREEIARETADRLAAMTASTVRVSVAADGTVEICKGRAATRLTPEEARAVKELLIKLTA